MLLQALATPLNRAPRQPPAQNQVVIQPSYSWVSSLPQPSFTQPLAEYNIPTWATKPLRHYTAPSTQQPSKLTKQPSKLTKQPPQLIPHMVPDKDSPVQYPVPWQTVSGHKYNTPTLEPTSSTKLSFSQGKDACPKDINMDKLLYVLMMREGFRKMWVLISMGFKNPEQAKMCSAWLKPPHTTHLSTSANVYGRGEEGENELQDSIQTIDPGKHTYDRHHCYQTMIGQREVAVNEVCLPKYSLRANTLPKPSIKPKGKWVYTCCKKIFV